MKSKDFEYYIRIDHILVGFAAGFITGVLLSVIVAGFY